MKTKSTLIALFCFLSLTKLEAQTYTHPTTGIAGEYVGACLVSNCGPFTYTDNGGTASNYSSGINQIYRTFCPSVAGSCLRVTFNSFNVEAGYDFLQVKNGATQNSPQFTGWPNSSTNYAGITGLDGNLNASCPFSFTATGPSGCLTFRFYSDGSVTAAGWSATIQCVPCAGGPTGTDNNDCINATPICSSSSITSNASGPGIVAEGCSGSSCPAGGENHTNWYYFTAQTSGTLNLVIDPAINTDDYDVAIYGPNVTCGSLGTPIRCTDSGATGNTGLTNVTPNQNSEDVTGDGWVETLTVTAGQSYYLMVDEWSPNSGGGYTLSFSGTASLDCTILPVELVSFDAEYAPDYGVVDLSWVTASERDNDRFELERSADGIQYDVVSIVPAVGNSTTETQYLALDEKPYAGVNYYRLKQIDMDGNSKYSEVKSVNILDDSYDLLSIFPNPTSGLTEVIFNAYTNSEAMLEVVGHDGRQIIRSPLQATKGGNRVDLNLTEQERGIYFITISTKEKQFHGKLIKE